MPGIARRVIALVTTASFLISSSEIRAAQIPPYTLPLKTITVGKSVDAAVSSQGGVNLCTGSNAVRSEDASAPANSPALVATPVYNSGNLSASPWGYGWYSELDQQVLVNADNSLTWVDGSGSKLTYFVNTSTSSTQHYVNPVNVYTSIDTASPPPGTSGTTVATRSKDGTVMTFQVGNTPGVLRLTLLKDRNGNTITYSRDSQGRLTSAVDIHGRTITLTYNSANYVATVTDPGNRVFTFAYDGSGNKISANGPMGLTSYAYNPLHQLTKITYPNGGVRNYAYDLKSRVVSMDDGQNVNRTTYSYGDTSTTVTDALGRITTYLLSQSQGLKQANKITDPNGGISTLNYDANMNLTLETDPLGHSSQYSYDAQGNTLIAQDAGANKTQFTYDPTFNMPLTVTDPLNRISNMQYDSFGNLIQFQEPMSDQFHSGYDTMGHMTSLVDPLGHETDFEYDSQGAVNLVTDPLNEQTAYQNDALSRITQMTDPSGKVTKFQYDAAGDLTRATDADNQDTVYDYIAGRDKKLLHTATDANGHATTFGYDAQGRVTSVTNALGHTKTTAYDAKSNLSQIQNARGQTITYTYDGNDDLTQQSLPEGQINYTYDAAGNRTRITHYNGSSIQNSYDALNHLVQQVQTLPNGYAATLTFTYDAAGNRTRLGTPWGNFNYEYDANDRLTKITNPQSNVFIFDHDATGRPTQLSYPNGITATFGYDNADRVTAITATRNSDGVIISSESYVYNNAGDRINMVDEEGTHTFSYDNLHRLTEAKHPAGSILPIKDELFSYDNVGNRLADVQYSYTYNEANELVSDSSFTYAYDLDGNLTAKALAGSTITAYTYNSVNQLVEVDFPTSLKWTYEYDGLGRRVAKSSGTASGQTTYYIYDGQNILAILDDSNNPTLIYTNGPNIDEPLMVHENGADYGIHADVLGSVRAYSSTNSAAIEIVAYQAYGSPTFEDIRNGLPIVSARSVTGSPFCFSGRECDPETAFLNLRARQTYDYRSGRFSQENPVGISDGINRYTYANNSPLNAVDPTGLDTYRINRTIGGTEPHSTWDYVTHTFIATTNPDGSIAHTFSWGNAANVKGWNLDQPEDRQAAREAFLQGISVTHVGDSTLDPFVTQAFLQLLLQRHQNLGIIRNCKSEATNLTDLAEKLRLESMGQQK